MHKLLPHIVSSRFVFIMVVGQIVDGDLSFVPLGFKMLLFQIKHIYFFIRKIFALNFYLCLIFWVSTFILDFLGESPCGVILFFVWICCCLCSPFFCQGFGQLSSFFFFFFLNDSFCLPLFFFFVSIM